VNRLFISVLLITLLALPTFAQEGSGEIILTQIATYDEQAVFDEGVAEIVSYDPGTQNLIVVNSGEGSKLDFINISDAASPTLVAEIDMTAYGDGANSVDVANGLVAVAVAAEDVDAAGVIVFLDAETQAEVAVVEAGVLPDMVTFTPDGSKVLVANEGEPSDDYSIDPEGSITIIDVEMFEATQLSFEGADIQDGVRIFGPDASPAQDLEPEYIAVAPNGMTAYVSLQENNAIAIVDIEMGSITTVVPLGFKDYSLEENAIDASNEDGAINIQPWPVFGMFQPDSIAAFEIDGETYIITANEGDARDYDTYSEEARIADITLDPDAFPNAEELQAEDQLGRLLITTTLGDIDGDGDFDELYNYGARSFSILNADGEMIFDSGNDFERITAELIPGAFNSQGANESFDNRSDDKGPEPEAATVGVVNGQTYAFIGMERVGGIFVYNVSDPAAPVFVAYVNNNNLEGASEELTVGDVAPEGFKFIPAEDSPTGNPLLAVANEVSGTTTLYEITEGM
jgi:2',3'-cyclic-nucleotide 2'-phosphodiesterase/3'-nucleotidase/5'-nucleotidase